MCNKLHCETACSAKPPKEPTAAEQAYKIAKYEYAESLLIQVLESHPSDAELNAALVDTLLHEGRIGDASAKVAKALAEHPQSGELLTARAEVQFRQGHPWLAAQTLDQTASVLGERI